MIAFEATRPSLFYQPHFFLLILAFFAYAIFLFANCVIDIIKTYKTEKRIKIKDYILPLIFSGGLLLAFTYTGIMYFSENIALIEIYEKYKSGEYEIVEGTVENFHPMPEELHDAEHFEVDGVYFEYLARNSKHYYSQCKKDGGFITGNGQKVKIWYVSYGGYNHIMQLKLFR